jgi:DNA polymerase III subunit delta'
VSVVGAPPGHAARWAQVVAAHAAGRLAHALLLAGPRGAGKSQFAEALATWLLCESAAAPRPCGNCRSCVQLVAGVHPNRMRLAPAEDKRDIAIDDIRDLLDRLHLSSHYGQAKVAIVDPADALNAAGANALLKTIEEPPPNTHVLLVAERWRSLPATLRSRCQILRFARPGPAAVDDAAAGEWGGALADAAAGNLQALRIAQGLKRDTAQQGLERWLRTATAWLRAVAAPGRDPAPPRGLGADAIARLLDDIVEALRALERNGNPTLLVESIMIRLSQRAASGR